jgi:hypothetical protein
MQMASEGKIEDTRGETYTDKTREFVIKALLEKSDTQSLALFVGLTEIADAISEGLDNLAENI